MSHAALSSATSHCHVSDNSQCASPLVLFNGTDVRKQLPKIMQRIFLQLILILKYCLSYSDTHTRASGRASVL